MFNAKWCEGLLFALVRSTVCNMTKSRFGVWHELRVIRERSGWKSADLARKTKVGPGKHMSPGYLSDLENGHRWPNVTVTKALADALNVPFTVLERHDGEKEAVPA